MDYRDELDRAAKIHGYEERDNEPSCSECIHNPMCSGKNCHFDKKWKPEDLQKIYYHVDDCRERRSEELYSIRDFAEMEWPRNLDGPFYVSEWEWRQEHPHKYFNVRLTINVNVSARDGIEARRIACQKYGLLESGVNDLDNMTAERMADADILHEYRMPVEYRCCEEGRTYGYEYVSAKNDAEAKYLFQSEYIPDIESSPCFNDIERHDESFDEWYSV